MAKTQNQNSAPTKAVTAVKKEEKKLNIFQRIGKWFREMRSELKKVVWPTRKQLINNTLIALGMMVVCAIVIWGFDQVAQLLVKALLSLAG